MSTEVISFTCPKCERKLRVKAALAGKQAKCPGCGQPLRVPTPKRAGAAVQAKPAPVQKKAPEPNDEFGLGSLGGDGEALFDEAAPMPKHPKHNPLANHVVENPGFAATDHIAVPGNPDVVDEGFARNPLIVQMEQQQQAVAAQQQTLDGLKAEKKADNPLKSPGVILGLVYGVGLFAALICGFVVSGPVGIAIAFCLAVLASPVSIGLLVWGCILVSKTSAPNAGLHIALFIFCPFYNIIYAFKNWKAMKGWFGAFCVTIIGSNMSVGFMILIGVIEASKNA